MKLLEIHYDSAKHGGNTSDLITHLRDHRGVYNDKLVRSGVIAFRGFPIMDARDFNAFVEALDPHTTPYFGQTERERIHENVYESAKLPGIFELPLHSEASYSSYYPQRGFFYCVHPAASGGESLFSDNRKVLRSLLDSTFSKKDLDSQILYERHIPPHHARRRILSKVLKVGLTKSWKEIYETDDKSRVDAFCQAHQIPALWDARDWLDMSARLPFIRKHPTTHENIWFNQVHNYAIHPSVHGRLPYTLLKIMSIRVKRNDGLVGARFGDGRPFTATILRNILKAYQDHSIEHRWNRGDIVYFDNLLVSHGRKKFKGRRVLLSAFTGYTTG